MLIRKINIKQLQYVVAIVDNRFNISLVAKKLFTSQPNISKQIRLLEHYINHPIFTRNGKSLTGLTNIGEQIIKKARTILVEYDNLYRIAEHPDIANESFNIATTATQSNYVLPNILPKFHKIYPNIKIHIQDGNMDQLIDIASNNEADCIILSGINAKLQRKLFPNMLMIPCYEWHQLLIYHNNHPLAKHLPINLEKITKYPIITYPISKYCGSAVQMKLEKQRLQANIFATSNDPLTIKNYTLMQMGVGLIAPMAYDPKKDHNLTAVSLENILPKCTTIIAVSRHNMLKSYVYRFVCMFAPHLSNAAINKAINDTSDIFPETINLPQI